MVEVYTCAGCHDSQQYQMNSWSEYGLFSGTELQCSGCALLEEESYQTWQAVHMHECAESAWPKWLQTHRGDVSLVGQCLVAEIELEIGKWFG